MISGNTGAGLVDVNIPENPLYRQSLPDMQKVTAAAWGLPSLDDIRVPEITAEKDIQTDTELTDKYIKNIQMLKDYAVKGRSVGIDVTKPKNDPTHLQYAQEWNKLYNETMQIGKELKTYRQNQLAREKALLNPNAIVGNPDPTQPFKTDLLQQYVIENPFPNSKMLVKSYQGLKPIFDEATFQQFTQRWLSDMDKIDEEAEMYKRTTPALADKIDVEAENLKASMFPPQMDFALKAKLEQAYKMHKDRMGLGYANLNFRQSVQQDKKTAEERAAGQFKEQVQALITTPGIPFKNFYVLKANEAGFQVPVAHTAVTVKGSDFGKYGIPSQVDAVTKKPVKTDPNKYYIVTYNEKGERTGAFSTDDSGIKAFASVYQRGNTWVENNSKQQQGVLSIDPLSGNLIQTGEGVRVGDKTTNTTEITSTPTDKTITPKPKPRVSMK